MIDRDIAKHARELRRNVDNGHFERTEGGILLPKMGAQLKGVYYHSVNGKDERIDENLIPDEGLNYLLNAAVLGGATALSAWYIALWNANVTPDGTYTAANFASTAGEITSTTEGYTEATRPAWQASLTATGTADNLAARADFTIATASSVVIRGAAVLSDSTRGGTTGVLLSIARFAQDRTQYDTDIFSVGYKLVLTSA